MIIAVERVTSVRVSLRSLWRETQMAIATSVMLGLAATFGYAAAETAGTTGTIVVAVVASVLCALVAVAGVVSWRIARGVRALVVDADGITFDAARRPWSIGWAELSQASVRVGFHRGPRLRFVNRRSRRWYVHLELVLADATYAGRHPEMAHLQRGYVGGGPDRYGLPFAQRRELIAPVDEALRAFAGSRYGGVIDDGELRNPGYQPN